MPYESNMPRLERQLHAAREAGLIAAAKVLVRAAKLKFRGGGYTSRAFSPSLNVGKGIFATQPEVTPTSGVIYVGTDIGAGQVPVFWEVGHMNLFTKRFERVERFMPALTESADKMRAAYARTVARFLGGDGSAVTAEVIPTPPPGSASGDQ